MSDPFRVVRDFEAALCEYTGAPYAVTVTSCTMALLLAVRYQLEHARELAIEADRLIDWPARPPVEIPKRTYVGVPMSIIHAGGRPTFRDEDWIGSYRLDPLPIWDCARVFTSGMYADVIDTPMGAWSEDSGVPNYWDRGKMLCVSFHWGKTLGIQQGGAILHDSAQVDRWLRMARFDGRKEGVAPADQKRWMLGWHCYMAPETAAAGLVRLRNLPRVNAPLPNDLYPDLSTIEIFR